MEEQYCNYCTSISNSTPASPRRKYLFCPMCGRKLDFDNKQLRTRDTQENYVILVKRGNIIKGIARNQQLKGHTECTIKPQKMKRFKDEESAVKYWNKYKYKDKELKFHQVCKMLITYTVIS